MTIPNMVQKCKDIGDKVPKDVLIVAILIVASIASFWLGFLAGSDSSKQNLNEQALGGQGSVTSPLGTTGTIPVVASKSGTKYYLPGCAGVDKITVDNRVWFATAELARAQGYELASNCKEI